MGLRACAAAPSTLQRSQEALHITCPVSRPAQAATTNAQSINSKLKRHAPQGLADASRQRSCLADWSPAAITLSPAWCICAAAGHTSPVMTSQPAVRTTVMRAKLPHCACPWRRAQTSHRHCALHCIALSKALLPTRAHGACQQSVLPGVPVKCTAFAHRSRQCSPHSAPCIARWAALLSSRGFEDSQDAA